MKKIILFLSIIILLIISLFVIINQKNITGFPIFENPPINQNNLENLRLNAKVECLQNSQCTESQECVGNVCIKKNEIDICQKIELSTPTRNLKEGDSINSIKEVLTKSDLSYLLPDGELVEIVNGEAIEYFYSPVILIGNNKIEKENGEYVINNNENLYTYKLTFSNPVDFSNKNLHGQIIRIFGEEYSINGKSDSLNIELTSKNKNIRLDGENIKITKDNNGNIISIEIGFNSLNKIKAKEKYSDDFFNKTKLSFDNTNEFVDIKIGGNC